MVVNPAGPQTVGWKDFVTHLATTQARSQLTPEGGRER